MAEAADDSTTWISLAEGVRLAGEVYHSQAEGFLHHWLKDGRVRWRGQEPKGRRRSSDPVAGNSKFWRREHPAVLLQVRWDEGWARRREFMRQTGRRPAVLCDYAIFGIEVAKEDLVPLLPATTKPAATKKISTKPPRPAAVAKPPKPAALVKRAMKQLFPGFPGGDDWTQIKPGKRELDICNKLRDQGVPEDQMPSRRTIDRIIDEVLERRD